MLDTLMTYIAKFLRYGIRILSIGKIRKDRVVFFSYAGKQYSCNPLYISEELRNRNTQCEIIWAFTKPEEYRFLEEYGISVVKYNSLKFLRILMTAGTVVTNSDFPAWWSFGKKQLVINTWHGGGAYKKVGASQMRRTAGKQDRAALSRKTKCTYLSSSRLFTKYVIREAFEHDGVVLECGMPRNDILINRGHDELYDKVRKALGIGDGKKIFLYAPTYRKAEDASEYELNCERVRAALQTRFGGEWVILYRMHYFIMNKLEKSDAYIDASEYPNMQELLYAADFLLTDYSSSIWDYALSGKAGLLYATDLDQYDMERGFYSDIHTWQYPLTQTEEELIEGILGYDEKAVKESIQRHFNELGSFENGTASRQTVDYILAGQK